MGLSKWSQRDFAGPDERECVKFEECGRLVSGRKMKSKVDRWF